MNRRIFAVVKCCRLWPIVWAENGCIWGWHSCGICGERPVMVEIDGEAIEWFDSSTA